MDKVWKFGEVCEHGSLGRKCEICELQFLLTKQAEIIEKSEKALNNFSSGGTQEWRDQAEEALDAIREWKKENGK